MIIPADIASETYRVTFQHRTGRPVPSPAAPLDNGQKARLCILAREAFDTLVERGAMERGANFEAWRHEQQLEACGLSSLRAATQRHYALVVGHLKGLLGDVAAAARAIERAQTEPRRLAMFKLKEALGERDLPESYAAGICWRQFKRPLSEASDRQVWCLVYTVRSRRKPVTRTLLSAPNDSGQECPPYDDAPATAVAANNPF